MSVHLFSASSRRPTILHRSLGRPAIIEGNPNLTIGFDAFIISGATLTGAGAALASCDVHLYRTADDTEVQQVTSDGSGVFTFDPVNNGNGPWYAVAYKAGAPDLAGTSKNILVGTASVNIYLRDPTAADGPGGSAAYRPVGSPVVRRLS